MNFSIQAEPIGQQDHTNRGFEIIKFLDSYRAECSVQESSLAMDDEGGHLWVGINDPSPKILKVDAFRKGIPVPPGPIEGWIPYEIDEDVLISTRMHLNRKQVEGLVARLALWLKTESLHVTK